MKINFYLRKVGNNHIVCAYIYHSGQRSNAFSTKIKVTQAENWNTSNNRFSGKYTHINLQIEQWERKAHEAYRHLSYLYNLQ